LWWTLIWNPKPIASKALQHYPVDNTRNVAHGERKCEPLIFNHLVFDWKNCMGNTSTELSNSWISISRMLCCSSDFMCKRWRQRLLFPTRRIKYLIWNNPRRIDPTAHKPFFKSIAVYNRKAKTFNQNEKE